MRNLKKFLAVVVAIAVMVTAMVPAFAAEATAAKTDAQIAETLKVLKGGTDGVTAEYLAKDTTRFQAAIVLLRLVGKEAEAKAFDATGKETFKDANLVSYAEGKNILAYLKAHPEYGFKGYVSGNFGINDTMLPQQAYKVLLQAMGYAQDTDYKYAEILTFADGKGLEKVAGLDKLTNNDLAVAIVEALKGTEKGGKKLVEKLVADKVIAEADATATGLIVVETATSATVKATGAKKLTVEFNGKVDDTKAAFEVKRGSIVYNVATKTWAADKKSVVLELASKIVEGDYVVSVTGVATDALTAKVTTANEKIAKLDFPSDKAAILRDGTDKKIKVSYKAYNQYEEDITDTASSINASGVSRGTATTPSKGSITITDNANAFKADDKVTVSLLDTVNNSFKAATFTVVANARVDAITIEKIYNTSDNTKVVTADTTSGVSDFKLILKAVDQYGNAIGAPANATDVAYLNADLAVSVSDATIATLDGTTDNYNFAKVAIDGTDYIGLALKSPFKAGKTVVTMVSKTTGKMATYTVEVKDTAKVDTISVSAPTVAAAATKIEIPFEAIDQFGNKMTKASDLTAGFNSFSATSSTIGSVPMVFEQDYVKNTAKLVVDARAMAAKGTVTLTFVTSTYKVVNLKIDVTDAITLSTVSGTKDFTANVVKTGKTKLDIGKIVAKDQYGQAYDLTAVNSNVYRVVVTTSDSGKVSVSGNVWGTEAGTVVYAVYDDGSSYVELKGEAKGSATITLKAQKLVSGAWTTIDGSEYTFGSKVVELADIASYEVAAFSKVYNADPTYGSDVTVNGILADGTKVVLGSETGYYQVVSTDANVLYNTATNKVYANVPLSIASDKDFAEVAVVVTVNANDGAKVFTPAVKIYKAAPAAETLAVDPAGSVSKKQGDDVVSAVYTNVDTTGELIAVVQDAIKTTDQYGKELTGENFTVIVTNYVTTDGRTAPGVTNNATNNAFIGGTTKAGDTFMVTATINGKVKTFKVVLVTTL